MRSSKTCSNEHYMEHQAIPVGPSEAFRSNHVMFDDCVINIGSGRRLPRETRDDQLMGMRLQVVEYTKGAMS